MKKLAIIILAISFLGVSCKQTASVPTDNMVSKKEMDQVKRQLDRANKMLGDKDMDLNTIKQQNEELEAQLATVQQSLENVSKQLEETSDDYGVWFRVQIGAYQDRKIDKDLETTDQLSLEEKENLQKIVLGRFRDYDEAKQLQEQLAGMGLKDAWIVSYKDGARVSIEEALKN